MRLELYPQISLITLTEKLQLKKKFQGLTTLSRRLKRLKSEVILFTFLSKSDTYLESLDAACKDFKDYKVVNF